MDYRASSLPLTVLLDTRQTASLFLLWEDWLCLELYLLTATYGGAQRVTPCCLTPTREAHRPMNGGPRPDTPMCSHCETPMDFKTRYYSILDGPNPNFQLELEFEKWFTGVSGCSLEARLIAAQLKDFCGELFRLVRPHNAKAMKSLAGWSWHPGLLETQIGLQVSRKQQGKMGPKLTSENKTMYSKTIPPYW